MSSFFLLLHLLLLSLAEAFQVLRKNSLNMAISKAGKQFYKFYKQVLVRISSGIREKIKISFESAMVSRFMAVAYLAFSVADFFLITSLLSKIFKINCVSKLYNYFIALAMAKISEFCR